MQDSLDEDVVPHDFKTHAATTFASILQTIHAED